MSRAGYGRAGGGASSSEEEHGDEAQGGPAVAVAAAWFTLCGCGGNIAAAAVALEPSVAASLARNGPTRQRWQWRGSPG